MMCIWEEIILFSHNILVVILYEIPKIQKTHAISVVDRGNFFFFNSKGYFKKVIMHLIGFRILNHLDTDQVIFYI